MIINIHKMANKINTITNIDNALYYIKIAFIQAPIEAALSLFCIESFLIYTKKCINTKQLILLVLIPIICGVIVCIIYTAAVSLYYFREIIKCYEKNILNQLEVNYEKVDSHFKTVFFTIHIIGIACYIGISIALPFIYGHTKEINLLGFHEYKMMFFIFGTITGCAWNLSGIFGDRRIEWSNIYKDLNSKACSINKIKSQKFHSFIMYCTIQIVILIALAGYFSYIMFYMDSQYLINANIFEGEVLAFSFFVIAFVFAIKTYVKIIYDLHFKHEFNNEEKPRIQFYARTKDLIS